MNNQTSTVPSTILRNKLAKLAIRLQQQAGPQGNNIDFNTREKVLTEAIKILSRFYAKLSEPGYDPTEIIVDTVPDAEGFNDNFQAISDDLEVVFSEFENLEGVVLGEFNYMVSRLNRLNRKLKAVSSSLGDFILFSDLPTKDAVFFGDSFNNLSRVEANSPLLNNEQCEVNQVEGIVTLPVDRQAQQTINITETPVINSNSNGTSGNNEELNAQLHGVLADVLDNNADTWFEYERVVSTDDGVALLLDFTINIGESKVINFVRVNPNNFGTRTQVEIVAIDTSIDGKDFVSIKDDIPIAGFIAEDEANVFTLAPSTSKFAGQGLYTFTPRKARYVHLTLKQTTPYTIETNAGATKHRYAIGVRDVDIQAIPYKTEGEIISSNYELTDDVRKVVLLSSQKPDASTISQLASIEHSVSPDNGVTWFQIRPRDSVGNTNLDQTVPEVLDFNGITDGSVATTSDVKSLRYRAKLVRNSDNFVADSAELAQVIASRTELHTPPTTTPLSITLQNAPIDGTLRLIDPQFGSRGKNEAKYQIATGNGSKLRIDLPFKPLVRDVQKVYDGSKDITIGEDPWTLEDNDPQQVFVNNIQWTRGALSGAVNNYQLNYEEGRLEFGDGTDGNAVPTGAGIAMTLSEERLYPGRGTDHIAKLGYPTSNDKKQVEIAILQPPKSDTFVLKKGTKRHQLKPDIVADTVVLSSLASSAEEDFVDGDTELTTGKYSVDYTNGMLYLHDATSTSTDVTIIYRYNPRVVLAETDWEFVDSDDGIADSISISDFAFQTFRPVALTIPTGVKYFNLSTLAVVRGSLTFSNATIFATEVEFIDGRSELLGVVHASEQLAPILGVTPSEIRVIPFSMKISTDPGFSVTFTDQSTFLDEKTFVDGSTELTVDGDYSIDKTLGNIHVQLADNVEDPGVVNYYYVDPQATLTGRYSVNYQTGEVFCHDATTAGITVTHNYSNYRMKYDIARLVPSDDWEFDASSKKITIQDREILRNLRTPQSVGVASSVGGSKYYQAAYQYVKSGRPDVTALEPYFSPVLKDYALKIITRNRLV